MSLTRGVAYNTTIQIVGKVITTIISLFIVAALTRYLGVAGFGQYTTIFAYTGFFGVLAVLGENDPGLSGASPLHSELEPVLQMIFQILNYTTFVMR